MTKRKSIVLFDIDHTIFDANLYRRTLYANLAKAIGSDVKRFSETADTEYKKFRKNTYYFTPDLFLKTILADKTKSVDLKKIKAVFWDKTLYEKCIYPDVKDAFSKLKELSIQIGIFSTGDQAHQKIKIESLKEYLSDHHVYIAPDKLKIIKGTFDGYKTSQVYLVDDYPEILINAKKHNMNIITVFITRKESYPGLIIPEDFEPDKTITKLEQLITIIKNH